MAKKDKELMDALRSGGVRKKVARDISDAATEAKRGKPSKDLAKSVEHLRTATSVLEERVRESQRSEAGKKAARTRKRNTAKRSAAAQKAARTRARHGH
jgi:hypothetical protein